MSWWLLLPVAVHVLITRRELYAIVDSNKGVVKNIMNDLISIHTTKDTFERHRIERQQITKDFNTAMDLRFDKADNRIDVLFDRFERRIESKK